MDEELCEVVITAPDAEWLAAFTRKLIEDRLCASGHNIASIRSLYRWQGEIYDRPEARVALHTRVALVPKIIERTLREHAFDVPGLITLPISDGNPAYLQWIHDETSGSN